MEKEDNFADRLVRVVLCCFRPGAKVDVCHRRHLLLVLLVGLEHGHSFIDFALQLVVVVDQCLDLGVVHLQQHAGDLAHQSRLHLLHQGEELLTYDMKERNEYIATNLKSPRISKQIKT